MCNQSGLQFGKSHLSQSEVKDKIVIEVGSRDVNGSIREDIESLNPLSYIGVDMLEGKGVDEICDVNNLVTKYGNDKFDLVISTELMEHVREWHKAISNLKNILKPDGILLLTTRSKGFGYHGFPFDFWRYEIDDMKIIFSDFIIEAYENDTSAPGVFIKARKPTNFSEKDLTNYELYSIIRNKRCKNISELSILIFKIKWSVFMFLKQILPVGVKTFIRVKILRVKLN